MADPGVADEARVRKSEGLKKRWRAWLRAIHRDVGYLSIGFTIIYAVSGIAQNHIEEWGDVSFKSTERQIPIAPIADSVPDALAIQRVATVVALGLPSETLRAGDEIRLTYPTGVKVTALGNTITIQERSQRFFIGTANWLHRARGKVAWKYISDVYALLLVYLAISGLFMIKGRLGLRWRGTILVAAGIAVPVIYVAVSGGPGTPAPDDKITASAPSGGSAVLNPLPDNGSAVLTPLPPDDN